MSDIVPLVANASNASVVVSKATDAVDVLAPLSLSGWRLGAAVVLFVAALLFVCSRKAVSIQAGRLTLLLKELGRKRSRSALDGSKNAPYEDGLSDDEEQRDGTRRRGKKNRPASRQTSPLAPSTQQHQHTFELEPLIRTESSSSSTSSNDPLSSPTTPTHSTAATGTTHSSHQQQPTHPLPDLVHTLPQQPLLTPRLQAALLPHLPAILAHTPHWQLVYSTAVHGHSLSTLYELSALHDVGACDGALLVCRDSDGWVFGCWTSERWERRSLYYGGAQSFVFTWQPTFNVYEAREETRRKRSRERRQRRDEERQHERIGVIVEEKQTGEQRQEQVESEGEDEDKDGAVGVSGAGYYQLAKNEHIALGGGERFALWLDSAFRDGTSGPCSTFDSPTLSKRPQFKCYELEVWGM